MGYARAGSNPAFGTILEYKQINCIRELGGMPNSLFLFGADLVQEHMTETRIGQYAGDFMVQGFAFSWTLPEPAGWRWNLDKRRCR